MVTRPTGHPTNRSSSIAHCSLSRCSLFIVILLLAAGLRLTRLDLVEFKYDEATTARSALAIVREGRFPAMGMVSSLGPRNPPLMSYVLALPFALSRDPRLAAGWVALLGVVAVGLAYWIGRAYFDWRVGALAALLFAVSPWAVFHSRKIWAQNVPALTLLFVAAVLALVVHRRPWALTGALVAAGCLLSLHLGGLAFIFILAVIVVLFRRHVRALPLLVGLTLLALILSPYLLHDARHGWPNMRAFADLIGREATVDLQAPRMAALIVGGYHLEDLTGARYADFVASILDLRWLDRVEMALLWAGLAWLLWRVGREALAYRGCLSHQGAARLVLLCWFAVPVALLLRHLGPVHPHDLSLLYPVQHMVIALLLVEIADCGWQIAAKALPAVVGLLVVALVGWQVYLQETLLTFVDTHDTPGGYGAPVKYALAAARQAEALLAETGSAELIVLLPGAEPRYDGQAAVFDVLLQQDHRLVDGRQALVLPAQPAVYLAHPRAEPAVSALAEVATEDFGELSRAVGLVPLRTGGDGTYRFFRWQPTATAELLPTSGGAVGVLPPASERSERGTPAHPWDREIARWASGTMLLGYDWSGEPRPGGTVYWTLYWRVEALPAASGGDGEIHWFNHLVDGEGNRWGQMDAVGFPASEWRMGDTVITWFDIVISPDAPPPPYFVRSGMYTYPEVVNVPLVDATGRPAGEFVELGPVGE